MSYPSDPERWTGLCFVASHWNANGELLASIAGVEVAAPQVVWGQNAPPHDIPAFLEDVRAHGLRAAGWGWCDATDEVEAAYEGTYHAQIALELGLDDFIANQEASYDAGGNQGDPRFWMPTAYFDAFRQVAPELELALTTTPLWASDHAAARDAGCVLMGQAFPLDNKVTIAATCAHGELWGWERRHLRPLVQVFSTNGELPAAGPMLAEADEFEVGLVPYPIEQAFNDAGRALLAELEPAISREPAGSSTAPEPGPEPPDPNGGDVTEPEPLPGGAFDDCAEYETEAMKRPDGGDATAFANRAESLKATRARVMELEERIIALEER